jgi:hypothetical protein
MGFLKRSQSMRRRPAPPMRGKTGGDGTQQRRQRAAGFAYGVAAAALAWAGSNLLFSADTHRRLHLPDGAFGDVLAFAMMAGWLTAVIGVVRRGLAPAPRPPQRAARRGRGAGGKSGTGDGVARRRTATAQPGPPAVETDGTTGDPSGPRRDPSGRRP